MVVKRHQRLIGSRRATLLTSVVIILVLALGVWAWHNHDKKNPVASTSNPGNNQSLPAASQNVPKTPASSAGVPQGSATDNHGGIGSNTSPTHWTVSSSGAITVKQPIANATLKSGGTLSGSSTLSQIQYRLVDNQVGKIAEGPISVVNGSFSAALQFTAHSSNGEIDVFSYDPNNAGAEINEVQIPVSF